MTLRVVRWGAQVAVVALAGLAFSTCQIADILRAPGAKNVVIVYLGDSTLVQGRVVAAVAEATADGAALTGARFAYASSDTTVIAVGAGDSLRPLKRGITTLTVSLTGAILPSTPPAITRTLRVVAGSIVVDSARVTFLSLGDTATLHATALDANGNAIPGAAAWRTSDTSVVSVSAAGKLLALKNGTATVHAILDLDSASVAVTVRQALVRFTFDQASLLIDAIGATATVAPTARDARGNVIAGLSPAWSSGDTTVAVVNATGTVTSVRVGSTFLHARLDAVSDSLAVTVTQRATRIVIGPRPVPDITSVNGQRQLNAVAYDRQNVPIPNPPLAWTVTAPTVLSVTPQGLVTGIGVGTARVVAALGVGADSVTVSVTNAPVSLRVAPRTASSTTTGDTLPFTAVAYNARGDTVPGVAFSWRSPDSAIVQVTSDGHAILKGVGTARMIAAAGALADTATVTATNLPTTLHFQLPAGVPGPLVRALTALGDVDTTPVVIRNARNADLSRGAVTWSVDDPTVVRVTALGIVTAWGTGQTLVRVAGNGLADSALYTVTQLATRVVISPKPVAEITSLANQRQLAAVAYDHNNVLIPSPPLAWTVTDPAILSVSAQGLVTGLAMGTAKVAAALGAGADSVTVTVTNGPVALRVAPRTASSTTTGDTLPFTAVAYNARGDTVPGVAFSWRSPDSAIVQVTSDGHAILKGVGTARVIAAAGALADTATLTATNLPTTLHFQLPSGVTLGPLERSLTAPGDVDTTPVVIQNARNADLSRGAATWSVDDPNIVRVTALGIVTARDTGRTLVRITANGLADSASYTVTNVPASIVIDGLAQDTLTALGQALPLVTVVTNHRGVPIAGYPVAWRSTNTAVADAVVHDSVTAKGLGTALLIATAGSTADTFTLVVRRLSLWTVDNASVVSSRVGSVLRPFAKIQDAVDVAGARDTVVVRRGVGAYSETVALSRSLTLLGDSAAFVSGGRVDPGLLPMIAHDSGAAGIAAITSAPMTIRYLAMRHSLDGPAVDANGSGMRIEYFYVNPPGSVPSRIGRGISIRNSVSGTSIARSEVDSVQGYGIRLETVAGATVNGVVVRGVDSLPGVEVGAGIKVLASAAAVIRSSVIRGAQVGVLVGDFSSNVRVDSNDVTASTTGMRIDGGSLAAGSSTNNDIYGNDSAGVVNPLVANLAFPGNWWGDGLGPRSSGTPSAAGDSAVGAIAYTAVRSTPLTIGTAPTGLIVVRGNNQSAAANTTLPLALAVRVVDANGFPVPGVSITFTITAGGRSLGGGGNNLTQDVTADAGGLAQTTLRLGQNPGQNMVTVTGKTVAIGSVAFTETGL